MTLKRESTYSATFFSANEDGDYLGLSHKYEIHITHDSLFLSEIRIPLIKVLQAEKLGSGASLVYVDQKGIPVKINLTTSDLFGIGRKKKINEFLNELKSSISLAKKNTPPSEITEAQHTVPPDTCHDCGESGGIYLEFGTVFSMIIFSLWSSNKGVYCRKHATRRGLIALLTTGALGWWSLQGLFIAPIYIVRNLRSLLHQSNLPYPIVFSLGAAAFVPGMIILDFIAHAVLSN